MKNPSKMEIQNVIKMIDENENELLLCEEDCVNITLYDYCVDEDDEDGYRKEYYGIIKDITPETITLFVYDEYSNKPDEQYEIFFQFEDIEEITKGND